MIYFNIVAGSGNNQTYNIQISSNNTTWTNISTQTAIAGGTSLCYSLIVPDTYYFRYTATVIPTSATYTRIY